MSTRDPARRQITWDPCTGIEVEPENPAEAHRWTPTEAARFLAYVADDPMGLMFRVMVLRGCRRAELCGFRWSFADLDRGVLTVRRPNCCASTARPRSRRGWQRARPSRTTT